MLLPDITLCRRSQAAGKLVADAQHAAVAATARQTAISAFNRIRRVRAARLLATPRGEVGAWALRRLRQGAGDLTERRAASAYRGASTGGPAEAAAALSRPS